MEHQTLAEPPPGAALWSYVVLDNITFSTASVPEPSALALSMMGALFIAGVFTFRKKLEPVGVTVLRRTSSVVIFSLNFVGDGQEFGQCAWVFRMTPWVWSPGFSRLDPPSRFMVPMHDFAIEGALHEPSVWSPGSSRYFILHEPHAKVAKVAKKEGFPFKCFPSRFECPCFINRSQFLGDLGDLRVRFSTSGSDLID